VELDPSKAAVLGLHWQNDIVSPQGRFAPTFSAAAEEAGVIPRTADLLAAARVAAVPVIFVRVCFRPGYPDLIANGPLMAGCAAAKALVDGEWGAQMLDELTPEPGDHVVDARRVSAFWGSDLDTLLRASGRNQLLLTGVATNFTVLNTAFDAVNAGYEVAVVADCCSSADQNIHDVAVHTIEVIAGSVTADQAMASFSTRS
jgi:nicotinamidase-related amidase